LPHNIIAEEGSDFNGLTKFRELDGTEGIEETGKI
jgi:hypothetical protein